MPKLRSRVRSALFTAQDRAEVARRFHSPEASGSSPLPARNKIAKRGMAEWSIASDLKSEKLKNFVGSNPTSSYFSIMRTSFLKRLKIKKKIIMRKKRNFRHLLNKKRSSRKRRLKKPILCFFNL